MEMSQPRMLTPKLDERAGGTRRTEGSSQQRALTPEKTQGTTELDEQTGGTGGVHEST